jgi:hypothetical protein
MRPDARRQGALAGAVQAYGDNGATQPTTQIGAVNLKFYRSGGML